MKVIIFCSLILLFACGCRKSSNSNQSQRELFPRKIGDTWVYHVIDSAFTFQTLDNVREYNMTVSIVDSTVLPGGIKANLWVYSSQYGRDTNYVFQNADTVSFGIYRGPELIFIRRYIIPLGLNQSWKYSTSSVHDVRVDSVANLIISPYQFNNACHISGYPGRPDEIINISEWIANNIGLVKRYVNTSGTNNPWKRHSLWSIVTYNLH